MNKIEFIYQYPIKGFPGEKLDVVKLRANEGLPEDRKYALGYFGSDQKLSVGIWLLRI